METIKTTKTVTKTIETVTTITTVEVITEIKTITVEEPLEAEEIKVEQTKTSDPVVLAPKKKVKTTLVEKSEPKITDPKILSFDEENEVEDNQVSTAVLHTLLYWDTETKHRKLKDDFIGQQLQYLEFGKMTYSKLWIEKDKFESVLDYSKGNYNLKPEFKARLEHYLKANTVEAVDNYNNPYKKLKPYTKVQDQDFEFFKALGYARKVKK